MLLTLEDLIKIAEETSPLKKTDNTINFINYMEFYTSDKRVPFYIIYWAYRKWCQQVKIKPTKIVSKHILSRNIGYFFKKISTYPKTKKFGVKIDYQMMVYLDSPFFPFTEEEEKLAFDYYHYIYDQERSKRKAAWKAKRTPQKKEQKEVNPNSQD